MLLRRDTSGAKGTSAAGTSRIHNMPCVINVVCSTVASARLVCDNRVRQPAGDPWPRRTLVLINYSVCVCVCVRWRESLYRAQGFEISWLDA